MPRKSDALTIEELQDILTELPTCKFSENVKQKINKKIRAEISRREKAGKQGGRPKNDVRETMRKIDQTAQRAFNEQENVLEVDKSQDWGA